jgi:hypothetical protein
MRRRNKILLGFGIGVGALILAAGVGLYIISRDEAPPDDSDLIVHRLDIPDDQNGFTYFQKAGEVIYWPGTEAWEKAAKHPGSEEAEKIKDRLEKMLDGKDWDAALAAEVLDANKPAFALIEKGLACREFQVPEVKSIGDEIPYVFGFLHTGRLMRLRAADLAARDKGVEAVERILDVVLFGHRIECAKGCLVNWLVGQTIKNMGTGQLSRLVAECKVPVETLKITAGRLAEWEDSGTGLADALRGEYQVDINTVDEICRGKMSINTFATTGHGPPRPSWSERLERLKVVLFLNPNQTKGLFAETLRSMVEDSTGPYVASRSRPVVQETPDGLLNMLATNNSVGRRLHQMLIPALSGVEKFKCRTQADVAATRAIVALKAFKMKTGRLPRTLDELVPEYLAAVPLDDFDGKPLRYSPEKKILYSVGKDLKDVGGFTKEETLKWWQKENPDRSPEDAPPEPPVWDLPNPSWPIEF